MKLLHDHTRRLQVGAAGLMSVLLLVGMAGLLGERGGFAPESATDTAHAKDVATGEGQAHRSAKSAPSEPLAELGVQPAPANARQSSDALPAPVAPGEKVPDLEPDPRLDQSR